MHRFLITALSALLTLSWTAGCGVPKEQHDKQVARNKALQKKLDTLRQQKEGQQGRTGRLLADLAKVRAALDRSRSKLARLNKALAGSKGAKAELSRLKSKMRAQERLNAKLRSQFKKMISAGHLKVVNVGGRLVIKMASKILFATGKVKLTRKGRKTLRRLARILRRIRRHYQVAGHSDSQRVKGTNPHKDNWQLAAVRACVVVRVLRKGGVPGKHLSAASYSKYQPVSSNRSKRGRKLNRRIEITLMPVIPRRKR